MDLSIHFPKRKIKRAHRRVKIPVLIEFSGETARRFWSDDLSEGGMRIDIPSGFSVSDLTGGNERTDLRIVIDEDEEPVHVAAEPAWSHPTEDGRLSTGWRFIQYYEGAHEQLTYFVRTHRRMQRIRVKDTAMLDCPKSEIYRAIIDPSSYAHWWPVFIRFRKLDPEPKHPGLRIEIRPFAVSSFRCEIEGIKENEKIAVKYYKGACRGIGLWRMTGNGNKTRITYEIDLAIQSWLVKIATTFIDISWLHSKIIGGAFRGLRHYLHSQAH